MQSSSFHHVVISGLGIAVLLLTGCSSITAGPAAVSSDASPSAAPSASSISTPAPATLPTVEQLGGPLPPTDLLGRWRVEGPGVLPETYLNLGDGFTLDQPCGELRGTWSASDRGRMAVDFSSAQLPVCITDGGRDWTAAVSAQRIWGDKVVLVSTAGAPDVALTRVPPAISATDTESVVARQFPSAPALPPGFRPLDDAAGWWVRPGKDPAGRREIDGIEVNPGARPDGPELGTGSFTLEAVGATRQPLDAENPSGGLCADAQTLTTLVDRDGSWTRLLEPPAVLGVGRLCEPYAGPKVTGTSPVDALRRAAGGGIDESTSELVLFDDSGDEIARFVSVSPVVVAQ